MAQAQEESERTMARLISSAGMPASVSELCEVVITAPDPDWPCAFARSLVEDRLSGKLVGVRGVEGSVSLGPRVS